MNQDKENYFLSILYGDSTANAMIPDGVEIPSSVLARVAELGGDGERLNPGAIFILMEIAEMAVKAGISEESQFDKILYTTEVRVNDPLFGFKEAGLIWEYGRDESKKKQMMKVAGEAITELVSVRT